MERWRVEAKAGKSVRELGTKAMAMVMEIEMEKPAEAAGQEKERNKSCAKLCYELRRVTRPIMGAGSGPAQPFAVRSREFYFYFYFTLFQ